MIVWLRYGLVFLAVAIGVAQAVAVLGVTQDKMLGSAAQIMVPAMIAALIEGQQYARKTMRVPPSGAAWTFAAFATVLATILNLCLSFAPPDLAPEFAKLSIAAPGSGQFLILLGLYAGGYLLANRFFFGIGAGNTISRMKSREERE